MRHLAENPLLVVNLYLFLMLNQILFNHKFMSKAFVYQLWLLGTLYQKVCRVAVLWYGKLEIVLKVSLNALVTFAIVQDLSICQTDNSIKTLHHLTGRLMNGCYISRRLHLSNLFQVFDSNESSVAIKPRCRLIEENNLWFGYKLKSN